MAKPLLKKARKAVHRIKAAEARIATQPSLPLYLGQRWSVQRARNRAQKIGKRVERYSRGVSFLDTRQAIAQEGLWGTRWIRRATWSGMQNVLLRWKRKNEKKLESLETSCQTIEESYTKIHASEKGTRERGKKEAIEALNHEIEKAIREKTQIQRTLRDYSTQIQPSGTALGIAVAEFDYLRAKIDAETGNPDKKTGAYRLILIFDGMETVEQLIRQGKTTKATTELQRLAALNANPPS